jgi:tRNA (guanine-N7-)-methyltransferase
VIQPVLVSSGVGDSDLAELAAPLELDHLAAGSGPWEVEIGFGKGRYLLRRATEDADRRFLGIELVSEYQQILVGRARRRGLRNLVALRGEALYLLSAVLPTGFASVVHVYFPDPWPKSRHHKRRLFDPESVDLVLGLLAPEGRLCFATDFLDYGEMVAEILGGVPELEVTRREAGWEDGARTNYEAKYIEEGRPILRLEGRLCRPVPAPRAFLEVAGGWEEPAVSVPPA